MTELDSSIAKLRVCPATLILEPRRLHENFGKNRRDPSAKRGNCSALLLGVEIDGLVHRADGAPERDDARDDAIRSQGIEVVRISADRVTMTALENAIKPFRDRRRWE